MRLISYRDSVREALDIAMAKDPSVIAMGIGVDDHKAIFGSTKGLVEKYGKDRVFDTPIAEGGMTGIAIGAALGGLKPVHIHIRADFLYLAMDQIFNVAAKWNYMFGGNMNIPIVVRAVIGRSWGQGAQHSQNPVSMFAHVPGLKVIMPTTAYDVKGLLLRAIRDPNPVVMIEHRLLYDIAGDVPEDDYEVPFGKSFKRASGDDVTVVANSYMVAEAMLAGKFLDTLGINIEIIDPVSIVPMDHETILASVRKTGRLLIVDSGWTRCGVSAEIAAITAECAHDALKAPVKRLGMAATVCPVSKSLEDLYYPNAASIARAVCELLGKPLQDQNVPLLKTKFKGPF